MQKELAYLKKQQYVSTKTDWRAFFAPTTASFAYFYQIESNSTPETVVSGTPLTWNNAGKGGKIVKIPGNTAGSNTFDLNNWVTTSGTGISGVISK